MFFNLLTSSGTGEAGSPISTYIMLGIMVVAIIVLLVFNRRSQKKKQQEAMDMLNAIKPGNKVKTIGGICGIVVELCPEDNTFVLETGTEASGKSYIKFDKQAVYQTDAVVEKPAQTTEKPAPVDETPKEVVDETAKEVVDETKTDENK
ncbi:MAG: preprotein translocase subunit YajC [Clostridia bacterium]|nr:preprotein translocase subunit YajC [Clostridia bacterium]